MKQNTRVWKYKAVPRIVLVWSVLPSTQRILHIVCKNLQEPTTNMTLNASWSSKDLLILFFRVFGWILRKTWFGVFKSKWNVYTMQVVDALHEVTCRFLESDARQTFVAARTNRRAPWRLTFLYQRKLFLLLEASFKDWFHVNVVFHRVENRKPWKKTKKQETLFQVNFSVKNRTTSCRLHSQQKNTKCSDHSHPISDSRCLNLAGNTFFYIRHLLVVSLHLQKIVPDHFPSIGANEKNMWTTKAHHLWRHQTQLVTPKPDGLQQGWMTSIPGCNLVKIGKST